MFLQIPFTMLKKTGKIVCFANNKGGVGKTTTAVAVGQAWARAGKKVLFVDVDSQANMTGMLNSMKPDSRRRTIRDAFIGGELPIEHIGDNQDLVPSNLLLSNFDRDTASTPMREHLLYDLLRPVRDRYDAIVIDCPPALGLILYNVLITSDCLVMVTTPDSLSYQGMLMMIDMYSEVRSKARMNSRLEFIGCVVCRYERNRLSDAYVEQLKNELGYRFIEPVVHKATRIAQAAAMQQSIYDFDPEGRATKDYLEVAARLGLIVFAQDEEEMEK